MNDPVHIQLLPLGKTLAVQPGASLQDVLFAQGVEFPCGGRGRCKGCRVKVLAGDVEVSAEDCALLPADELAAGWRLSCRARARGDLTLELAQWEATILADDTAFAFTPQEGLGVAVDLGTTTVVAQLLDRRTGHVLAVRTALNAQGRHGADIMSRIDFASHEDGQTTLVRLIRKQIGHLIEELLSTAHGREHELSEVVIVGNTVMHHLFCDVTVEPLSRHPFEPADGGLRIFSTEELGWRTASAATVRFLPCLGSFVGSDILAGVLATRLHESEALVALVDLGTNGEMVVGNRDRLLCASTAAGPAFEGARISMGMRAATGAISEVNVSDGEVRCRVLGNVEPRGICGSGLVDAIAAGLEIGRIQPSGRMSGAEGFPLAPPVSITQADVRELQLAKGAIAAGLRILVQQWGARLEDVSRLYLAGAFGNYINRASARRIGLIELPPEKVVPAGNTALLGAKLALFSLHDHDGSHAAIRRRIQHVPLNEDPLFQEIYVEAMGFPG
ncbi:MAG: ASKHA domain-containing protein [Limisphaerales bacterium]